MKSLGLLLALSVILCSGQSSSEQRLEDNEKSFKLTGSETSLSGKQLERLAASAFDDFDKPRLATLNLSYNRIAEIANGTFRSFYNLRILSMCVNHLRKINASTFADLMSLEELDLSSNSISEVDKDAFSSMSDLRTVDLSVNCIIRLPNYLFFRNVRLINIHLKHNQLSELPMLMPTTQFVENFNVSDNRFTNITSLLKYNNIQSLDVSDNPLVSEEMTATGADVAREGDDDDSASSSEGMSVAIRYGTGSRVDYFPSPSSSSPTPAPRFPFAGRRGNRDRIDFSSDVNFIATSRARVDTSGDEFTRNVDFLTDTFRSHRMSEEALDAFIKSTMERKPGNAKVSDMIRVLNTIGDFYRSQNRQALRDELESIRSEKRFDVASLLQWLKDSIKSETTRTQRHANNKRVHITAEQLQMLVRGAQINHLEYFTCRNCSLRSTDFLANFPELKYINVVDNQIRSIDDTKLARTLRYLLISNNELEALNFASMLENWTDFQALIANDNPDLHCDLIAQIEYKVAHLSRAFKLEVNKCK
jgi:Leucine-rich repeat (LRR) protein